MAKVKIKVKEIKSTEKETEFEYPVYLYFQDEDCLDELVKIEEHFQTTIKYSHFGVKIEKTSLFSINEFFLINNQTSKEHFEKVLAEAKNNLT